MAIKKYLLKSWFILFLWSLAFVSHANSRTALFINNDSNVAINVESDGKFVFRVNPAQSEELPILLAQNERRRINFINGTSVVGSCFLLQRPFRPLEVECLQRANGFVVTITREDGNLISTVILSISRP